MHRGLIQNKKTYTSAVENRTLEAAEDINIDGLGLHIHADGSSNSLATHNTASLGKHQLWHKKCRHHRTVPLTCDSLIT
jgi:hypothetical protein